MIPAIGRRRWVPRGPQEGLLKRPRNSAPNGILGLREELGFGLWLAVAARITAYPWQRANIPAESGSLSHANERTLKWDTRYGLASWW